MLTRSKLALFDRVLSVICKRNQKYANLNRRGLRIMAQLQQIVSVEE